MKSPKFIISILLCVSLSYACTDKENLFIDNSKMDTHNSQQIVLGEKLDNPYTLKNMQRALDTLLYLKGINESIELEPTDYYVKFQPADTTEYRALYEQDFELFDYPLDYEIINNGESYHDPSIPDGQITWQYTVIPDDQLTETVKYDKIYELKKVDGDVVILNKKGIVSRGIIIDNCFIPKSELKSATFPVSSEELEDMAIKLVQKKEPYSENNIKVASSGGYPHGSIKMYDGRNNLVGVPGIKVRARYFLKWKYAYTNGDGDFSFSSKFSKSPHFSIVFDNIKGFTIWGNWAFLAPAQYAIGTYSPSSEITYSIQKASKRNLWDWSVISKSSYDYYAFCSEPTGIFHGVQAPPSNMKIWCIGDASESASTPMSRHLKTAKTLSAEATIIAFCADCLALQIVSGIVSFALYVALPDMFIGTKELSYNDLYLRMFHEYSHASHFQQIGEYKWGDIIMYEMLHNGYGKTRDNSKGENYVELTESYSYAMQNYARCKLFNYSTDYHYFSGRGFFFKGSMWHYSNLLIEEVIAPSAMSKALNGAAHINDLNRNMFISNGGSVPQLNQEFAREIPYDL